MDASQLQLGPAVSVSQVEYLLAGICRHRSLRARARQHLKAEHFHATAEPHYRLLWNVLLRSMRDHGEDVISGESAQDHLRTELMAERSRQADLMPDNLWRDLLRTDRREAGLLQWIYEAVIDEKVALDYLGRFLRERDVQTSLRDLAARTTSCSIGNLAEVLRQMADRDASYRASRVSPVQSASIRAWRPEVIERMPVGINFLDTPLRGGHVPGEVYGVLGAYGSGKTMLSVQITGSSVRAQFEKANRHRDLGQVYKPRHSYLFHYEAARDEIMARMISYMCEIEWESLMSGDLSRLSSAAVPSSLKPYEVERWRALHESGVILGEKERIDAYLEPYASHIHLIDMSCPPEDPLRGRGYVDEIAAILEADAGEHEVGCVVIDYAGLCCRRHMMSKGMKPEHLRHLVGGFADACKSQIAQRFRCPVWVMHQASAASNKRTHAAALHYSDAAEAGNFAENLAFSFELGVPHARYRTVVFSVSKSRRAPPVQNQLLLINGSLSVLEEASHRYVLDAASGAVVPVEEAALWGPPAAEQDPPLLPPDLDDEDLS